MLRLANTLLEHESNVFFHYFLHLLNQIHFKCTIALSLSEHSDNYSLFQWLECSNGLQKLLEKEFVNTAVEENWIITGMTFIY